LDERRAALDQHAAGGEVGTGHVVDERGHARVGRLDQMQKRVADLDDVVRRDIGRHADGDAGRAVGEQIGEGGGEDDRLLALAVVGVAEIDRVLVEPAQQIDRDGREPRFGVAHRRRVIAVDVPEIALPVDQRIALGEILRETHQRVVDRLVAVGMVFADHVADDARALLESGFGVEAQLLHRPEQAPMDGLQPVAHVGQRAGHDGRQRVGEVAFAQRVGQGHGFDFGGDRVGHGDSFVGRASRRQRS
jgi:hypothetical protein